MHRMLVGQLDDLVALHHVEADPGDAAVRLVVHEQIAAVIGAVGERGVRVVEVAVEIDATAARQELPGLGLQPLGQDLEALVGLTPARGAAAVEDRDAHQLAHRRQAHDPDLAGLAAREEDVILIQLADADGVAVALRGRGRASGQRGSQGAEPADPCYSTGPDQPGRLGRALEKGTTIIPAACRLFGHCLRSVGLELAASDRIPATPERAVLDLDQDRARSVGQLRASPAPRGFRGAKSGQPPTMVDTPCSNLPISA